MDDIFAYDECENIDKIIASKDMNGMLLTMKQSGYRQGRQEEDNRQSQLGFNKGFMYYIIINYYYYYYYYYIFCKFYYFL